MRSKPESQFYRIFFLILIPVLILIWSKFTSKLIHIPLPKNLIWSYGLLIVGFCFLTTSFLCFRSTEKELSVTESQEKNHIKKGIYTFIKYPYCAGTVFICYGLTVFLNLSSGFWLVSPLYTLMVATFIIGIENESLSVKYDYHNYKPYLSLPQFLDESPTFKDRLITYILAYIPFRIIYEAFIFAGPPSDSVCTNFLFESHWLVNEPSVILYELLYPLALLIPVIIKTKKRLRSFIFDIWFVTIISGLFFFIFPFFVEQRSFIPETFLGKLLLFDRSLDGEAGALPSFHVIWAFLAARYFTLSFKKLGWIWYLLAILISISCITTANHSLLDVIAGFMTFLIIIYRIRIWNFIRLLSEYIGQSCSEWRWGQIRLINVGFYAGFAGFVGTIFAGFLLSSKHLFEFFIIGIFYITGACTVAQFIKDSPKFQRHFSYYGGVVGVIIGIALNSVLFSSNFYLLIGVSAMIAPWIQAIGSLYGLAKGSCYGKSSEDWLGVRYKHARPAANRTSRFNGINLHPIRLYSIGINIIVGLILIRFFNLEMSATFITGIFLILTGLGRFVEESFCKKTKVPCWAGVSTIKWMTLISVLLGIVFTTLPSVKMATFNLDVESYIWAISLAVLATVAYGIDFPLLNWRFARLT
jgi:hypothetical protein